jgi:hypothetical protein
VIAALWLFDGASALTWVVTSIVGLASYLMAAIPFQRLSFARDGDGAVRARGRALGLLPVRRAYDVGGATLAVWPYNVRGHGSFPKVVRHVWVASVDGARRGAELRVGVGWEEPGARLDVPPREVRAAADALARVLGVAPLYVGRAATARGVLRVRMRR